MSRLTARLNDRLIKGIKRFQPILSSAKTRDINESDTVIIITDILYDVLGYDKYSEITSEYAVRGTYCDLALRINGQDQILIEAKAIGLELKDSYVKQAVDYAANKGIDWVILTNGIYWRVYKVSFSKPINQELIMDIDFLSLSTKSKQNLELLFCLTKEGWVKSAIELYREQREALNRFIVGALLLDDAIVGLLKREIRKLYPDIKIKEEQIRKVLLKEILKREVIEGEKAKEAKRKVNYIHKKSKKTEKKKNINTEVVMNISPMLAAKP